MGELTGPGRLGGLGAERDLDATNVAGLPRCWLIGACTLDSEGPCTVPREDRLNEQAADRPMAPWVVAPFSRRPVGHGQHSASTRTWP